MGSEANIKHLLIKARFEEAKQKELAMVTLNDDQRRSGGQRDVASHLTITNDGILVTSLGGLRIVLIME